MKMISNAIIPVPVRLYGIFYLHFIPVYRGKGGGLACGSLFFWRLDVQRETVPSVIGNSIGRDRTFSKDLDLKKKENQAGSLLLGSRRESVIMTPGAIAVIISTPYPINFWPFFFFFSSFLEWRMEGTRRIETKDIYTHKRATSYRSIGLWNTAIPVGLRAVRPLLSVKVQSNKNSWNLHINQWWREESHSTPSWILNALARSAQCYAVHYCIAPIIIKKWSVTNVVITAPYNGAIIRWCWEAGWMVGGLTLVVVYSARLITSLFFRHDKNGISWKKKLAGGRSFGERWISTS